MIIDLILDRYDGKSYNARNFYYGVMNYKSRAACEISRAMDAGGNDDVKRALNAYIINGGYNPNICKFIDAAQWLKDDAGRNWQNTIDIMQA